MPLKITTLKEKEAMEKQGDYVIADRRLYHNADKSELVEDGDPEMAFLYATPGTRIPLEYARKMGLVKPEGKARPKAENKAVEQSKTEDKSEKAEWPLKTDPKEYLEKYGDDAPKAELAREVLSQ